MSLENNIDKTIARQIAHIMASYGDQPFEFLSRIKDLVLEWHAKGVAFGVTVEQNSNRWQVNRHTRAGQLGKVIFCPHCNTGLKVYNFAWSGLICPECKKIAHKGEWTYNHRG